MKKIIVLLLLVFALALTGCVSSEPAASLSQPADPPAAAAVPSSTQTPAAGAIALTIPLSATPTQTLVPSPTAVPTLEMFPLLTFAKNANCRKGPGTHYYAVLTYLKGDTAQADGRSQDGSWISVQVPNGSDTCWVSLSTVEDFGDVDALHVITAQTLPDDPSPLVLVKNVCGSTNVLLLEWAQVGSVQGYRVYRDGELMSTKNGADNRYYDTPRHMQRAVYAVEAYNEYGVSNRLAVTIPGC